MRAGSLRPDPVPAPIELRGVSKRYETVMAANNVSLTVEAGTLIALTAERPRV